MAKDELEDLIDSYDAASPGFRAKVEAETELRALAHALRERRKAAKLTQAAVAERMQTSQAVVSQLERGVDVHLTTLLRYLKAIGSASLLLRSP